MLGETDSGVKGVDQALTLGAHWLHNPRQLAGGRGQQRSTGGVARPCSDKQLKLPGAARKVIKSKVSKIRSSQRNLFSARRQRSAGAA